MRVLFLGASGFIGRELFAALAARGHEVVPAIRDGARAPAFSTEKPVIVDLNRDTTVETWLPRLEGIDAVVNCAGILQGSRAQSIAAIHSDAPIALFNACERAGVRRVIQVSAISAESEAGTAYAMTKLAADEYLRSTRLDWIVLRPSLVHARGAHGGTALFRAMAALPFAILLPGEGAQPFQPIHVDDLARVVVLALESERLVHRTIDPVGPEVVTLRAILEDYRRWLGAGAARIVAVPMKYVRIAAALGDRLGGPLNSTAVAQLEHGNAGDYESFHRETGVAARGWKESLAASPSHAQDRWHARLYFVRPILRYALAFLWIISGVAGTFSLRAWSVLLSMQLSMNIGVALFLLCAGCALDLAIGVLMLRRWRPRRLAAIQLAVILGYTVIASVLWPSLWAEPLGPLFKNIPILAAVLAWGAIEEDR